MQLLALTASLSIVLMLACCSCPHTAGMDAGAEKNMQDPPTPISSSFSISENEATTIEANAANGDKDACMRLARYHAFIKLDMKMAGYYYRKAAPHANAADKTEIDSFLNECD